MKVFNYIILTLGMIFILHLAGIDTGSTILNIVGINDNGLFIDSSGFYNYLFGAGGILMLIAVGAGIVASLYSGAKTENFIILPLITAYLVNFVTAIVSVMNYCFTGDSPSWLTYLIMALLAPLTFGLVFSLVEFFRGTD